MNSVHKGLDENGRVLPVRHLHPLCVTGMCSTSHTMPEIEPLRNTLGIIKALYNFLEASPKRHSLLSVTEVQGEDSSETDAEVIEQGLKTLLTLSSGKDPKTYSERRALLTGICDWEFIFGLCLLKVILSNTSSLCRYLQVKTVDVISARRNTNVTIQTLRQRRNEESFNSVWQIASAMSLQN